MSVVWKKQISTANHNINGYKEDRCIILTENDAVAFKYRQYKWNERRKVFVDVQMIQGN